MRARLFWSGGCALWLLAQPTPTLCQCFTLTQEHVDLLSVHFDPTENQLSLKAADDDHDLVYEYDECIVQCPESMKFSLPAGTPLGEEGTPIWILPQNPYAGVPYVGVSAEALAPGSFQDRITIRLLRVDGPGHFLLWQSTGFGDFEVRLDSRDGIDDADRITPAVGAHEHYNWGFTTNGVYHAYFQAEGRRTGQTTTLLSPETPLTFHVLPLSPFELWTVTNWPCQSDPTLIAPEANPDLDGAPNAIEFAVGTNPNTPDPGPWLTLELLPEANPTSSLITFTQSKAATNATLTVVAIENLTAPQTQWRVIHQIENTVDLGDREQLTLRDEVPINSSAPRFYRLRADLAP